MDELKVKQLVELKELLEDTIEYYCDENMVSGESAWTLVFSLNNAKKKKEINEITS